MPSSTLPSTVGHPDPHAGAQVRTVYEDAAALSAPWYLWMGLLAATFIQTGAIWDLSWHRSIGRDSFWTPAHMMVQAGGITAAVVCGYLVLATTFGKSPGARAAAVGVFGLRAPIGAFIAAWGGITMAASAPFDNWWHATYGLDVRIVSPPHAVLLGGVLCVELGVLILNLAAMNRAEQAHSPAFRPIQRMFLYVGGIIVVSQMYYGFFYMGNPYLHSARPYKAAGALALVVLVMISQAQAYRWSATVITAIYTGVTIASMQILPLFPAEPKLGPVFFPVTHMVPSNFPILILVPAIVLDLVWRRTRDWKPWLLAPLSALVFIVVLVLVEWPFADFLMSRWAENRFFGTMEFGFSARPADLLHVFTYPESGELFSYGILKAILFSSFGAWLGILFGRWMRGVRR